MITIDKKEFQTNIDEYIQLGQEEEIAISEHDQILFIIVPEKKRLKRQWESFFDSLPEEALNDERITHKKRF